MHHPDHTLPTGLSPTTLVTSGPTPIQVYGAWHCGNDYCTWATRRDPADFDAMNHWLIDRGDGAPSLHVLGGGTAVHPRGGYGASEHLRRRGRGGRDGVRRPDPDASAAAGVSGELPSRLA
jgi:hypothetical protein